MSGQDEGAIEALANIRTHQDAHSYAILGRRCAEKVLAAIRDGEVPGVHLSEHLMGHSMARLQKEITDLRAQLAAAKADVHDMFTRGDAYMHKSDRMERERDALAGLLGDINAWLTSPKMAEWHYHENGLFAEDTTKVVNRISAALAGKGGGDGWVKCDERMPEAGNAYMTATEGDDSSHAVRFFSDDNEEGQLMWTEMAADCVEDGEIPFTHWRKLPLAPTKEDQ